MNKIHLTDFLTDFCRLFLISNLFVISITLNIEIQQTTESQDSIEKTDKPQKVLKSFGELCLSNSECAFPLVCDFNKTNSCICSENRAPQRLLSKVKGIQSRVSCLLRAGSSCSTRNEISVESKYYQDSIKKFGKIFLNHLGLGIKNVESLSGSGGCVENARCDGYLCLCNPNYFKDSKTGLCLKKRSMFQQCQRDDECGAVGNDLEEQDLICGRISSRCECPSYLTFDIRTMKCHVPAGGKCDEFSTNEADCVPNSECLESEGVCSCLYGFRRSQDGSCSVDYGLPCGNGRSCSDMDLACRSGHCVCKFSAHQYYDDKRETCVGKVSAPCDILSSNGLMNDTEMFSCTENSICKKRRESEKDRECQCIESFAEDENGKCVKSYGADCDSDLECDNLAQLVCLNGRCGCPDGLQEFDKDTRQCRGFVDSRCTINYTSFRDNFRTNGIPNECVENASCTVKVSGIDGRCECKFGYEEIKRRCVRKSSKFLYQWNEPFIQKKDKNL